jgi:hypothetical protein
MHKAEKMAGTALSWVFSISRIFLLPVKAYKQLQKKQRISSTNGIETVLLESKSPDLDIDLDTSSADDQTTGSEIDDSVGLLVATKDVLPLLNEAMEKRWAGRSCYAASSKVVGRPRFRPRLSAKPSSYMKKSQISPLALRCRIFLVWCLRVMKSRKRGTTVNLSILGLWAFPAKKPL